MTKEKGKNARVDSNSSETYNLENNFTINLAILLIINITN